MVNRADINSVLLQMRQVRQQMQATDPAALTELNTPATGIQNPLKSSTVGAPQNSFAAQLQTQRTQMAPSIDSATQVRHEITQQDLINQAEAFSTRPVNQMNLSASNAASNSTPSIAEMMGNAINQVNETQMHAGNLGTRYTQGDPNIDLPEVMVAMQKSSVSFQAMSQVRNKLLEAYKDIMNMPV
jgi:flagellar hook-basal body complex protein FliE